jgi:hypothetical protein
MSISLNKSVSHFDGDYIPSQIIKLTNQTGAALVEGDMVAVNLDFANTTFDELNASLTDGSVNVNYLFSNAVSTTVNNMHGILAFAKAPIANGARGDFAVMGLHRVKVTGTLAVGALLTGAAGVAAPGVAGTQVGLTSLTNITAVFGTLLEANASGTNVRLALINSFFPRLVGRGAS